MKNTQKGFIIPLLIAIIAVLAISGGVYVYEQSKTTPAEQQQPVVNNQVTTNQPVSAKNNGTTVSATINKNSLIVTSSQLTAIISGTASNTNFVSVQIVGSAPAKVNGEIVVLSQENIPVKNGLWSLTFPTEKIKGGFDPYKVKVSIGLKPSGDLNVVVVSNLSIQGTAVTQTTSNNTTVSVTSPVSGSSFNAGDTISVKWTPTNFSVIEIALIPENIKNNDGTNKAVWSGYGGEMGQVAPITSGKYDLVIPKQIPSDTYKIRIISDYSKYEETSYFSGFFTIKNSQK